jgi:N-acetylneuraminic acid mutarotase
MLDRLEIFINKVDRAFHGEHRSPDLKPKILNYIRVKEVRRKRIYRLFCMAVTAALVLMGIGIVLMWQPARELPREIPVDWEAFQQEISLADGSTLRVTPQSKYEIAGYRDIVLNQGQLWLNVVCIEDRPFQVDTPSGKVIVRGTEFVVQVLKKEEDMKVLRGMVAVLVISGVVELVNPAGREIATSGEYLYAQQGSKPRKKKAQQRRPTLDVKVKTSRAGKVLVWGGFEAGALYDLGEGKWKEIAEAPIGGKSRSAVHLWGSKVFIWGGYNVGGGVSDEGAIYDVEKDEWEELPEVDIQPRYDPVSFLWGSKVFIWGGGGPGGWRTDGAIYDLVKGKWEELPEAPIGAGYGCSKHLRGSKVFIWGGNKFEPCGAIYDLKSGKWEELPEAPIDPRRFHVSVLYDSKVFIWGGADSSWRPFEDGAIYDLEEKRWEELPEAPIGGRYCAIAYLYGSKIFIWGGRVGEHPLDDGAIFDLKTKKWTEIDEPSIDFEPRWIESCVALLYGPKFFIWGGRSAGTFFGDGAIYDLEKGEWKELPEAPVGGSAYGHSWVLCGSKVFIWSWAQGIIYDLDEGEWGETPELEEELINPICLLVDGSNR